MREHGVLRRALLVYRQSAAKLRASKPIDPKPLRKTAQLFRDWKAGPDPFAGQPIPPVVPRRTSSAILVADNVPDVTIRIVLQGPSVASDTAATYAADLLFDLLNAPTSAFQRRMVRNGAFQSVTGTYVTLNHTGPIEFVGKTTPGRAREALLALVGELDDLGSLAGITEEDLAIARKRHRVRGALTAERTAMLAPLIAYWWSSAGIDC